MRPADRGPCGPDRGLEICRRLAALSSGRALYTRACGARPWADGIVYGQDRVRVGDTGRAYDGGNFEGRARLGGRNQPFDPSAGERRGEKGLAPGLCPLRRHLR